MLYKVGGFALGTSLGAGFVCVMDDIIYGQLRQNVILPFKQVISTASGKHQVNIDELINVGSGTANFVSQFKPHELGRTNVKALLLNDEDYSTPHDHYFGYINKRQMSTDAQINKKELDIMHNLGLEVMLPPTYNIDKGVFEEPKSLDA